MQTFSPPWLAIEDTILEGMQREAGADKIAQLDGKGWRPLCLGNCNTITAMALCRDMKHGQRVSGKKNGMRLTVMHTTSRCEKPSRFRGK